MCYKRVLQKELLRMLAVVSRVCVFPVHQIRRDALEGGLASNVLDFHGVTVLPVKEEPRMHIMYDCLLSAKHICSCTLTLPHPS